MYGLLLGIMNVVKSSATIYRGNKKAALFVGIFFFSLPFLGLTLPLLVDGLPAEKNQII